MNKHELDPLNKEKEFLNKNISIFIKELDVKKFPKAFSMLISTGNINFNDPTLFIPNDNIDFKENCFIIKGPTQLTTIYFFEINPYKKIYLSFNAKSNDKIVFQLFAGFQTFDKNFKHIQSESTNIDKSSFTILTEPLESGMNTIKVLSVINYKKGIHYISYHARSDLKDLPNRNLINLNIESINLEKNEIILSSPINIPKNEILPIGTGIRIHSSKNAYNYCANGTGSITNEWVKYEGSIKGFQNGEETIDKWRPKTKYVKLNFLVNYQDNNPNKSTTLIRDIEIKMK